MDFYTISGLGLLGAVVAFSVIAYYYNRKFVPLQHKKGRPSQPLTRLANSLFKNGYTSKEPFLWLNNKHFQKMPYGLKKLLSLRNVNILLNLITIALIALKNENWWLIPVIQTIANIIAYAPKHQIRNNVINKMTKAASRKLGWKQDALINPWAYVRVLEWDGNQPIKVQLTLDTDFDATNPATREGLERHFDNTVSDKNRWSYEWLPTESRIVITPVALLPEMADYPGSENQSWNEFIVGEGINGPVSYDIQKYPHVLVGGTTGSGKSVLQRNIIFHCIQHNYMWRFLGVDLKRVELGPFKKYETTVMGIAAELEDGVEIVRYAQRVMNTRYTQMEEAGVNHFTKLIDPKTGKTKERALLIMVDEAAMFMGSENVKTDEGKARDELHGEAVGIIGALARLGRAAGIHLLLATQRPDATFIPGETKNNLDVRIAAGRLDSTPSSMILDNGAATMLPGHIKGRGLIRYAGMNQEFQGYYAEPDWIDEWLENHPGVEPTIKAAPGQVTEDQLEGLPDSEDLDFEDGILSLEADIMSPDVEKFATGIEEEYEADELEELERIAEETENLPESKKKSLFSKKKKSNQEDKEPATDDKDELYLNMDDDEDESGETSPKPRISITPKSEETPELSPAELAILKKMKQTFGEEAVEEVAKYDPLEGFDLSEGISGIPAFSPENEFGDSLEEDITALPPASPATSEQMANSGLPELPPKKDLPSFPRGDKFPPPPKGFPPPPAVTKLPKGALPPPPKGFPPPPVNKSS